MFLVNVSPPKPLEYPKVKVIRNVNKYPLHHVTYSTTKFEVATNNGLGGDTFTRNVKDGRTDRL